MWLELGSCFAEGSVLAPLQGTERRDRKSSVSSDMGTDPSVRAPPSESNYLPATSFCGVKISKYELWRTPPFHSSQTGWVNTFPFIKSKIKASTPSGQNSEVFQHRLSSHSYSHFHLEARALMFYFPNTSLLSLLRSLFRKMVLSDNFLARFYL